MKHFYLLLASACLTTLGAQAQRGSSRTVTTTRLADVQATYERTEAIALEAKHEMLITPLIAEVRVIDYDSIYPDPAEADAHRIFSGEYPMGKLENVKGVNLSEVLEVLYTQLKASALYDFCRREKSDLIVMPQFKITHRTDRVSLTDDAGASHTAEIPCERDGKYVMLVEVTGFPALYTGFRTGKKGDSWIKDLYLQGTLSNQNVNAQLSEESSRKIGD